MCDLTWSAHNVRSLSTVPTSKQWQEMRNQNGRRRKLPVDAASGSNGGLGIEFEDDLFPVE